MADPLGNVLVNLAKETPDDLEQAAIRANAAFEQLKQTHGQMPQSAGGWMMQGGMIPPSAPPAPPYPNFSGTGAGPAGTTLPPYRPQAGGIMQSLPMRALTQLSEFAGPPSSTGLYSGDPNATGLERTGQGIKDVFGGLQQAWANPVQSFQQNPVGTYMAWNPVAMIPHLGFEFSPQDLSNPWKLEDLPHPPNPPWSQDHTSSALINHVITSAPQQMLMRKAQLPAQWESLLGNYDYIQGPLNQFMEGRDQLRRQGVAEDLGRARYDYRTKYWDAQNVARMIRGAGPLSTNWMGYIGATRKQLEMLTGPTGFPGFAVADADFAQAAKSLPPGEDPVMIRVYAPAGSNAFLGAGSLSADNRALFQTGTRFHIIQDQPHVIDWTDAQGVRRRQRVQLVDISPTIAHRAGAFGLEPEMGSTPPRLGAEGIRIPLGGLEGGELSYELPKKPRTGGGRSKTWNIEGMTPYYRQLWKYGGLGESAPGYGGSETTREFLPHDVPGTSYLPKGPLDIIERLKWIMGEPPGPEYWPEPPEEPRWPEPPEEEEGPLK